MSQPLTTDHLDGIRADIRENTKDILAYMKESFEPVNSDITDIKSEIAQANTKLDAIMTGDVLVTRSQLRRLLEKLKIDEREIFTT